MTLHIGNGSLTLHFDNASMLDVGACMIGGTDLAPGAAIPDDGDARILRALHGFLFSCGPDHVRHPWPIVNSEDRYPLHGSYVGHAAVVTPTDSDVSQCQGVIDLVTADGAAMRLERKWHLDPATGEIVLSDRLTNCDASPRPVFQMYHINIAGRLLDDTSRLRGAMLDGGLMSSQFTDGPSTVLCMPAAAKDGLAEITVGPIRGAEGCSLRVRFSTDTLPFLQLWRNRMSPVDVLGIEPVSHRLATRDVLEQEGAFVWLHPDESRDYEVRFSVLPAEG